MKYTLEGATQIRDFTLSQILSEHNITRNLIAMVPDDKLGFPAPVGEQTVGGLMWFLVESELDALEAICTGVPKAALEVPAEKNAARVLAWDAERFPKLVETLVNLSGEELLRPLKAGDVEFPVIELFPIYMSTVGAARAQLAVALSQAGVFEEVVKSAAAAVSQPVKPAPSDSAESDTLSDEELSAASGGVFVSFHYNSAPALPPPQTFATLGSVFQTNNPTINGIMGILAGVGIGAMLAPVGAVAGGAIASASGTSAFGALYGTASSIIIPTMSQVFTTGVSAGAGVLAGTLAGGAAAGGIFGGAFGALIGLFQRH